MKANKRIDELEKKLNLALTELKNVEANYKELDRRICEHDWKLSGSIDFFKTPPMFVMISDDDHYYKRTCRKCGKFEYIREAAYHELKRLEAQKIVDECNKKLAE